MTAPDLLDYYRRRAHQYERVYDKPERQRDLARLARSVKTEVTGRSVLEVACGTGYWTERYAPVARTVVGVDASPTVLEIAKSKPYDKAPHLFEGDAYAPADNGSVSAFMPFSAAVVAFWWSHVPNNRLVEFTSELHRCLEPGSVVWVCDNRYVEGSSTPISHSDDAGNTYQRRHLDDGSEHVVLKNFPTEAELRATIGDSASAIAVEQLQFFWVLRYVLRD